MDDEPDFTDGQIAIRWIFLIPVVMLVLIMGPYAISIFFFLQSTEYGPNLLQKIFAYVVGFVAPPSLSVWAAYHLAPTLKERTVRYLSIIVTVLQLIQVGFSFYDQEYLVGCMQLVAIAVVIAQFYSYFQVEILRPSNTLNRSQAD